MDLVGAILFGSFIGWVSSLVWRSDTSAKILTDITVGALGALALALLLGNSGTFDNVMAAMLGASISLAILHFSRRGMERSAAHPGRS